MELSNIIIMVNFEKAIETVNFEYDKSVNVTANIQDEISSSYHVPFNQLERISIQRCNETNVKMLCLKIPTKTFILVN